MSFWCRQSQRLVRSWRLLCYCLDWRPKAASGLMVFIDETQKLRANGSKCFILWTDMNVAYPSSRLVYFQILLLVVVAGGVLPVHTFNVSQPLDVFAFVFMFMISTWFFYLFCYVISLYDATSNGQDIIWFSNCLCFGIVLFEWLSVNRLDIRHFDSG